MVVLFGPQNFEAAAANMVSTPAPFDSCTIAGSNTVQGSTSSPLAGTKSMRLGFNGTSPIARGTKSLTIPVGFGSLRARTSVRWNPFTLSANTYIEILRFLTGGGTAFAEVRLRESSGSIRLQLALQGPNVQSSLVVAAANTIHTVELEFYHQGTNDVANLYLNGTLAATVTDTNSRFATVGSMQFIVGSQVGSGNPGATSVVQFDDTTLEALRPLGGARACWIDPGLSLGCGFSGAALIV